MKRTPRAVNIQVEPDQPDIATPPKMPDEVIQSSDSDSDDSDIQVPVVRGRGSYGLRPNPAKTQARLKCSTKFMFIVLVFYRRFIYS